MSGEGEGEGERPNFCHEQSNEACVCTDWHTYTEVASRASLVSSGKCVVVQQSSVPAGEAGAWFGAGLSLALLICWALR